MGKVKIYRDPNVPNVTVHYNHGPIQYKFDINGTVFEVEKEHATMLAQDCEDLTLTKVVKKVKKVKKVKNTNTNKK